MNKHLFTNCGVEYAKLENGDVVMNQDAYIKTLRPIVSPELTGAPAEAEAERNVADQFVSLRGALAYTLLTQAWIHVYVVSFQRILQPKNLDVRRLNAVTRKLQKEPKQLIFPAMECLSKVDLHVDSGYRRLTGEEDEEKGYGMRGANIIRRGRSINFTKEEAVHLVDTLCKSHRLAIRSSYGAETVAAAHGMEDAYPTVVTLHELKHGILTPAELKDVREQGGLSLQVILTTDAESVYKSLTSRDMKVPTEKTLLGHVSWIRELLQLGIIESVQWCDTRDMTADGHTKGSIDRQLLWDLMSGHQAYKFEVKTYTPHRSLTNETGEVEPNTIMF
jgi:hypothetical protein